MTVVVFPNTAYTPYIIYTAGFLVFASFFSSCDIMCRLTFLPHLQSTIYFPFCQGLFFFFCFFSLLHKKAVILLCTKRKNTANAEAFTAFLLFFLFSQGVHKNIQSNEKRTCSAHYYIHYGNFYRFIKKEKIAVKR